MPQEAWAKQDSNPTSVLNLPSCCELGFPVRCASYLDGLGTLPEYSHLSPLKRSPEPFKDQRRRLHGVGIQERSWESIHSHPMGLSRLPGLHTEVEHGITLGLGTGFPGFPQELVLQIVINKQQQEAAGRPGLGKYINQAKLENPCLLQRVPGVAWFSESCQFANGWYKRETRL